MRLVLAGLLCLCVHAQQLSFNLLGQPVIEERFARLQADNAGRADALRTIFAEAGCDSGRFSEQKVRGSKLPNLICVLPGSGERRVVITAHYDKVKAGEGAIDNWSGAALLPSLFQSLSTLPHHYTFVFLLTTDEEKGLVGALGYVKSLEEEEKRLIAANVNIDCVGLPGEYSVWTGRADSALANAAGLIAANLGIPLKGVSLDRVGDGDSHAFLNERIPVIDFHSLTQATFPLLHSKKDLPNEVDMHTYYQTYRLLTVFLTYLDTLEATSPQVVE